MAAAHANGATMATLIAYRPFDISTFPADLVNGNNIITDPTHNRYQEALRAYDLYGSGFDYGIIDGALELIDGTINRYVLQSRASTGAPWETVLDITGMSLDYASANNLPSLEALRALIFQGADSFTGSSGNDVLNGYAGADAFMGGGGDDVYVLDNAGDVVTELFGQGFDTIRSTVGLALPDNVENVVLLGAAPGDLTGNNQGNALTGSGADNVLDGGRGPDNLSGLGGSDTYYVDSGADSVTESAAPGTDEIVSLVSLAVPANVENATASPGVSLVGLVGNSLNNILTGNDSGNLLDGGVGNDTLNGGAGDDTLVGGDGNDTLIGGDGSDMLLGGNGADILRFDQAPDGGNVDRAMDFVAGTDDLQFAGGVFTALTGNFAEEFVKGPGVQALEADDHLLYDTSIGRLYYDADGSGAGNAALVALFQGAPNINAADLQVA
jgi:Ca2+-binding RTX toxin-like protein